MAVALADFRKRFPEFRTADDSLVLEVLEEAALEVDEGVWGKKADKGIAMLCAHRLAVSPMGQQARMVNKKDGTTTYGKQYREMLRQVTSGYRLI